MKKLVSIAVALLIASTFSPNVFAAVSQDGEESEVFLSLTKSPEKLSDLTTNLTVITEEEIKEKSAKTLGDIIEGEIGISYKNNGPLGQTQSVFMRGATSAQTLVLIDGRKVNEIALATADFTAIPASMIERVEIIRGSGAAVYGTGAFGGVINVITKKATEETPNVNPYFSFGTFKTMNAGITGAYANDWLSILAAPSMTSSDGYRPNSFYNSKNIFGKIAIKATENSEFVLSGQAYNADIGNPGAKSDPSPIAKQFEDNNYLRLDYNTKIDDFNINVFGYNSNSMRKASDLGGFPSPWFGSYNTSDTGVKGTVSYKDFLTLGLEYDKVEFKQKDVLTDTEEINKFRESAAAYLQAVLNIGNLTLIPVVRGDINNDYEDVFTPALSAIFKLTDEIKISGNVSKVFRAPSFNDLYFPWTGNPDLKPEKGWSYDLGVEYSQGNFTGMITGFYIDSEDLINYDAMWIPQNIDKARQYGYEVGVKYDMMKEVSHKLNYTYTRAEDKNTHKDLIYKPMHVLNYVLTVKPIKALKISADVSYVTTTLCETGDYLDDYCLLGARADYQIMEYVSLWVKGNNLTNNDKYQLSYDYPMPGITGTMGFDIKF